MDRIELGATGRTTTRLGFGCSSVMGALGRRESGAMLEAAFDAGIRHFDVAPMYGFGQAEGCLGEFLGRHRGEVTVTTKYGIPPLRGQGWMGLAHGLARAAARPVVRALPGLKRGMKQVEGSMAPPAGKASFTAAEARDSLERSLRELRTDHIDVWLLHEATVDDLRDDGLLRLLEDAVASGKIGSFGVGSERARVEALLAARPEYCATVQFEWSVMDPPVGAMKSFRMHHRALTENIRGLHARLAQEKTRCAEWSREVGADLADRGALAALMLKAALEENPESVILFSSKRPEHIRQNVDVAGDDAMADPARRLYALVQRVIAVRSQPAEQVAR
jgi:aryl-alcohol dehydrogenase-like predicted oxidoreductase